MPVRKSEAIWKGSLAKGSGTMKFGSGAFEGKYSAGSRFEQDPGTNPEELIGAAHAGCFSQAFSLMLTKDDYTPDEIRTTAKVHLNKVGDGFKIEQIDLEVEAKVPGIDESTFKKHANAAKDGCPVSQALQGVKITVDAKLM